MEEERTGRTEHEDVKKQNNSMFFTELQTENNI